MAGPVEWRNVEQLPGPGDRVRITVSIPAGPGSLYSLNAWDRQIGRQVPAEIVNGVTEGAEGRFAAQVTGARVSEDRKSVELDLELWAVE